MWIPGIIDKKKRGGVLSADEVSFMVDGFIKNTVKDYHMSALLMAICINGITEDETIAFTNAMIASGEHADLSGVNGETVEKHSTGGVADTTTLIVAPIAAACGARVAKMSGRGLGHTGGTIDKLESIPGYRTDQTAEAFLRIVNQCGVSVIGQSAKLAPADKAIYSLRDATGTVDQAGLIASSIMSKKIAAGSRTILLDVKVGSGAFMKSAEDASQLGRIMVEIGKRAGRNTVAIVTDMNQPLGRAVGNANEVQESIEILKGQREGALKELSLQAAAMMLSSSGLFPDKDRALDAATHAIESGSALDRLQCMIEAHGGDGTVVVDPSRLPQARYSRTLSASRGGYVGRMDAEAIGNAARRLGAGRVTKEDAIDPAVGFWMDVRLGDRVETGEPLLTLKYNSEDEVSESEKMLVAAIEIIDEPVEPPPLIYDVIS